MKRSEVCQKSVGTKVLQQQKTESNQTELSRVFT